MIPHHSLFVNSFNEKSRIFNFFHIDFSGAGMIKLRKLTFKTGGSKLARERFASEALGARIESAGEGHAVAVADITDAIKNAEGSVMGGVLFTLADFAFAAACYASDDVSVTLSSSVTFLTTAKGKRLVAEAVAVRRGRRTNCYRVDVRDELGTEISTFIMNGFVVK